MQDWFEIVKQVPYMSEVYNIKYEQRLKIPAVTHIDGSGRLQTVTKKDNIKFYNLIYTFYKKFGVPILLNTSFNENEPIVESPQQAIECFLRTKMDVIVLEDWIITRS
jgi:carbamoyltransferase